MPIPKHLDWMRWRPVVERIATLQEIDTHWDIIELWDAHEALDLKDEVERRGAEAAKPKKR